MARKLNIFPTSSRRLIYFRKRVNSWIKSSTWFKYWLSKWLSLRPPYDDSESKSSTKVAEQYHPRKHTPTLLFSLLHPSLIQKPNNSTPSRSATMSSKKEQDLAITQTIAKWELESTPWSVNHLCQQPPNQHLRPPFSILRSLVGRET